jgi:hypothetical protein
MFVFHNYQRCRASNILSPAAQNGAKISYLTIFAIMNLKSLATGLISLLALLQRSGAGICGFVSRQGDGCRSGRAMRLGAD